MERDELIAALQKRIFNARVTARGSGRKAQAERRNYGVSIVEYPEYHEELLNQINEVLGTIDDLNLDIVEPGEHIPKRKLKLTRPELKRKVIEKGSPTARSLRVRRMRNV